MIPMTPTSATPQSCSQVTIDFVAQFGADGEAIAAIEAMEMPDIKALVTAARLRMRYASGPMRRRLDQLLLRWDLSEEHCNELTRAYWAHFRQPASVETETVAYGSGSDTST